jgi:DGQHR domain-containing protein
MTTTPLPLVVRAVRTQQGGHDVYAFFAPGSRLLEIAEVPNLQPKEDGTLKGFQRPKIQQQVRAIAEYLGRGSVLFPNAIILALAPGARFVAARGSKPTNVEDTSEAGTLTISPHGTHSAAWIVDGQQRALALTEVHASTLQVPVVAFVSGEIAVQREQFILVNKARPLPARLIDELLPEVTAPLPRDLSVRKLPSALCNALNESKDSPFFGLIKRPSNAGRTGIVTDSSLTRMMRRSIQDPRGALAACLTPDGTADVDAMFHLMVSYWSAVREVFPTAWGLTPERSRLMHSAGIEAMGVLMDQIVTRRDNLELRVRVKRILLSIAPYCHWTSGEWDTIGRRWDDIQNTTRDVRLLSNLLVSLERQVLDQ